MPKQELRAPNCDQQTQNWKDRGSKPRPRWSRSEPDKYCNRVKTLRGSNGLRHGRLRSLSVSFNQRQTISMSNANKQRCGSLLAITRTIGVWRLWHMRRRKEFDVISRQRVSSQDRTWPNVT